MSLNGAVLSGEGWLKVRVSELFGTKTGTNGLNCREKQSISIRCRPINTSGFMVSDITILALPEYVGKAIMVEWLGLAAVAKLDAAFCSKRLRPFFQTVAYGGSPTYHLTDDIWFCCLEYIGPWFLARNVRVDSIALWHGAVEYDGLRRQFLSFMGSHLKRVEIMEGVNQDCRRLLQDVANWCPGVQDLLVCSDNEDNDSGDECFAALARLGKQLRTLRLVSINISPKGLGSCQALESLTVEQMKGVLPVNIAIPSLTSVILDRCSATDEVIVALGQRCPKLQSLKMFRGNAVTDVGVRAVLQGCPLLRETDVEHAVEISPKLRVELTTRANFKVIDFQKWENVDDLLLEGVLRVSPQLTSLHVQNRCISDAVLAACAEHCPLLETLVLPYCKAATVAGVVKLLRPGNRLRAVKLQHCTHFTDEVVLAVAQHCPLLEEFKCSGSQITNDSITNLATRCGKLSWLDITRTCVGDEGVLALAHHCGRLQNLYLGYCPLLTCYGVSAVAEHCTNLVHLTLPGSFEGQPIAQFKAPQVHLSFA
jgi:hypothetical protein